MAELMNDIRHIPPWLIVAGVGGLGAVFLLARRTSSGAVVSTVPAASITATPDGSLSASGLAGGPALGDATQLQSMSTLPQTSSAAPAAPTMGESFTDALGSILPSVYSKTGFSGGPTDSAQGEQDLFNTLSQFHTTDASYTDWLARTQAASASGDVNQFHQLLQQGEGYASDLQGQSVAPVGSQSQYAHTPMAGGGSSERIVDILPHGYATEMTPGVLARWTDWMGGALPAAGLDNTQRYVARATHHELAARHKAGADDAVNELLGGV